jgi:hypothetical protein
MSPYKDIDKRIARALGLKYPKDSAIIAKHYCHLSEIYILERGLWIGNIKPGTLLYRKFKEWLFDLEDSELKTIIILQELSR